MTTTLLSVLIVEDLPDDAEMLVSLLAQAGLTCAWQRVETAEDFARHLDPPPDLIFTDFELPAFSARVALCLLKDRDLDVPCIVVAGTGGADEAVACMRAGAADFLHKDRLDRFGQAVRQVRCIRCTHIELVVCLPREKAIAAHGSTPNDGLCAAW